MKIGVDLHGFLDSYSPALSLMLEFLRDILRVEIYVLSGPERKQIEKELFTLGYLRWIHYDEIFSIVDYLKEIGDSDLHQDEKGHWWTTNEKWFSSKAKFCEREKIEVVFDDKTEYRSFMHNIIFYQIRKEKK